MRTIRRTIAITLSILVILAVAACGSASSGLSDVGAPVDGGGGSLLGTGGQAPDERGQEAAASAAPSAGSGGNSIGDIGAIVDDAKIIRTGTIELEVRSVPEAVRVARDAMRGLGGYIGTSQTFNDGDQPVAQITYRIPSDRWEEALDVLRGLNGLTSKVVSEQTQAVEVTGQIVDLEARIRNLRSSETALQGIAASATRISDVLEVQAQLTAVRGEIEQLTAQLADLEDRAGFATLAATFRVPIVAVDVASADWDPAVVVDEASASLIDVLQGLTTAGIWFAIVWLPILAVLGFFAAVAILIARRIRGSANEGGGSGSLPPAPTASAAGE